MRRWLREDALKPWQYRSWILIRDPDFRTKAAHAMDLYARTVDGAPLGEDEYVISADERTSVQARCRCHPTLAPGQARAMRVNHECQRGGAPAYHASWTNQIEIFFSVVPGKVVAPGCVGDEARLEIDGRGGEGAARPGGSMKRIDRTEADPDGPGRRERKEAATR
ncbi:hypothetical protein [Streptomyces sp. NPDC056883]|uniref:hypothetical protein n=1 Tax=Streptomyces sp. NPDC056883 TaxID=3345959 RepID=UPI00369BA049